MMRTVERPAPTASTPAPAVPDVAVRIEALNAWYGTTHAVGDVALELPRGAVTAIIGPSGCGKSTLLRCLNRMHETTVGARVAGQVFLDSLDIYWPGVDPVAVRSMVAAGMGVALVPRLTVDAGDDSIVVINLAEELPPRRIVLAWHRDRYRSPAMNTFIEAVQAHCATLDLDQMVA